MPTPDSRDPVIPKTQEAGDPNEGIWPYLGVGCLTFVSGFFGGGMIAVLVAKIVGGIRKCAPAAETGAPCDWFTYAVAGACLGMVLFPATAILLLRRSRMRQRNTG